MYFAIDMIYMKKPNEFICKTQSLKVTWYQSVSIKRKILEIEALNESLQLWVTKEIRLAHLK